MMDHFSMDRRSLLGRAMILVGVHAFPGSANALVDAVKAGKRQLDPARFRLLTAIADTIIPKTATPGAVAAKIPQKLDALLANWATETRRAEITAAMDRIDASARKEFQRGFGALLPKERAQLLVRHDAAALKLVLPTAAPAAANASVPNTVDPNYSRPKQEPVQNRATAAKPLVADPGYSKLKELVVVLFYYSETALTHDLAYEHAPGKWQPSIPITLRTRPWGGPG